MHENEGADNIGSPYHKTSVLISTCYIDWPRAKPGAPFISGGGTAVAGPRRPHGDAHGCNRHSLYTPCLKKRCKFVLSDDAVLCF